MSRLLVVRLAHHERCIGGLERATLVAKLLDIFIVGAGQEIEECVEAAIERAAKLGNGAVEGV